MEQQLCDYLYICHAVGAVKKIAGEQDVPREVYKVSRVVRVTLEMPAGFMYVHMHAPHTVSLLRMFVEMEAPLGGAKREHFTLEVLPQLLQKGDRLAVQEPARDPQMSVDERLYRAKVHRWRETRQSPGHLSPCLRYLPGFRVHYEDGPMAQCHGTCAWYVRMQWNLHSCGRLQASLALC